MSKQPNRPIGKQAGPMHGRIAIEKAKDTKGTIKRMWQYLRVYKKQLVLVVVCILIYVILSSLPAVMLTPIIDNYIVPMITSDTPDIYVSGLIKTLIIFIGIVITSGIAQYTQSKLMIKISQTTIMKMREDLFAKIEQLPIKYFDTHKHGELMSRITNDLDNVSMTLNTSLNQIVSGILTIIISLVIMIIISPILTIVSILTIPIMIFIIGRISKITKKQFMKQQECLASVNGYIEEYISGQKVIKAFNKEEQIKDNFDIVNQKLRKEGFKAQAFAAVVMPIMGSINNISTAITCVIAGLLAINGKISIGSIATFNQFARHFSQPINEISQQFNIIQAGLAGAERMFLIIDEEIEFDYDNIENKDIGQVKGNVEFKNVSFGYNEDKLVLKNININAKPGELIAIVGPTGAGKTTIINLLTRFYDINEGEILIDGKNIKDVNKYSLRNSLGIVLQDTVLFSDSVKENIRFGRLDATDKEIEEAAVLANADSFIRRLPNGYDTLLKEDATNISVGQRQLLNIARVVLNDPEILILDEATSNVDTRTEVKIQKAMYKLLEGRTSFVIAHRLSTIRNADKILVLDNGSIVEQGSHDELIEKKGMYFNMYNKTDNEEE